MKRKLSGVAGVLLLLGLIWSYKLILGKPFSFNHAVERVTITNLLNDPEMLSFLGMIDNTAFDFHSDKLTDASPAYEQKLIDTAHINIKLIQSYNRDNLGNQEKLTYDILEWYCNDSLLSEKFRYHQNNIKCMGPYPVNQLFGIQGELPDFMASTHRIINSKSAEYYISRLNLFNKKFDQVIASLKKREDMGVIPPKFVIDKVIDQMNKIISTPPENSILYTSYADRLDPLENIDEKRKEVLKKSVLTGINSSAYPGYTKLIAYMKKLKKKTTPGAGMWKLPNGDAYYQALLRYHTTTSLTPEEIHKLGLSEVKRIHSEMKAVLHTVGMGGTGVGTAMKKLSVQKQFLYPDNAEGRKQILAEYSHIIDGINSSLENFFGILPKQKVIVKRIPEFKEKGSPGAYYNPPAMDGSRPGVFYANLRNVRDVVKYGMKTLTYHEAIPGHHLQIAIAQELKGVPTFRKVFPFTAYIEGWALYAERLAWEQGFQNDPYDNLGRLQAELFRAARLVVDTGIHYKKWTREKAIAYMFNNTGMPKGDVTAEIERYIVMPGQACAYKIGMLKILKLREEFKKGMGEKYSIKTFHDLILKNGSMPLEILEKIVRDYISKNKI